MSIEMHTSNEKALVAKHPGGRPKLRVEDVLPSDWKELLLAEMMAGASDVEIKGYLWFLIQEELIKQGDEAKSQTMAISDDLFYRWFDEEHEFSRTIKTGKRLAAAWWQMVGRKNVGNKNFNHALWFMNMRNRFGWTNSPKDEEASAQELNNINELFRRLDKAVTGKNKS